MSKSSQLRELIGGSMPAQCAGVMDAGQARLVEQIGFPAVYLSGALVNYSHGLPDGSLTMSQIVARVREIAERTSIPLVADADEGFGALLNVIRTVEQFERAGASAIHLEDIISKKHGDCLPIPEMQMRIRAACDARKSSDFLIIARTDSVAPWRPGIGSRRAEYEQDCYERCAAYIEAGADLVMPIFVSPEWYRKFGNTLKRPVVHLGGVSRKWPNLPEAEMGEDMPVMDLARYNIKMVIYGTNILIRTFDAMKSEYQKWIRDGRFLVSQRDDEVRHECLNLVGQSEKAAILARYSSS